MMVANWLRNLINIILYIMEKIPHWKLLFQINMFAIYKYNNSIKVWTIIAQHNMIVLWTLQNNTVKKKHMQILYTVNFLTSWKYRKYNLYTGCLFLKSPSKNYFPTKKRFQWNVFRSVISLPISNLNYNNYDNVTIQNCLLQ